MKSEKSLPAKDFRAARAPGARHLAAGLVAIAAILFAPAALAQSEQKPAVDRGASTYSEEEIVREAGDFFGDVSKGLADAVHSVFERYGEPNAYIKGEEAGGAFVLGLRYGQGELVMKSGTRQRIWSLRGMHVSSLPSSWSATASSSPVVALSWSSIRDWIPVGLAK